MPIFEYACSNCGHEFEVIVRASDEARCPSCHSDKLHKQLSVFAVSARSSASHTSAATDRCRSCRDSGGDGECPLN